MPESLVSMETLIAQWRRTRDVELEAAQRLDPGTRERELLEESADTYDVCADELAAHLHQKNAHDDVLVRALTQIRDEATGLDCPCDHATADCCARIGVYCPVCLAAVALQVVSAPPARRWEIACPMSQMLLRHPDPCSWCNGTRLVSIYLAKDIDGSSVSAPPAQACCDNCEALKLLLTAERESVSGCAKKVAELSKRLQRWQPIESAPKDGAYVLVFCDEVYKARYDDENDLWYFDVDGCAVDPTHWMPLPLPPAQAPTDDEDTVSRVDGVPGVGHGDLPREDRNEVVSASEPKGTYNCPICGWNEPHREHAGDMIQRLYIEKQDEYRRGKAIALELVMVVGQASAIRQRQDLVARLNKILEHYGTPIDISRD